MDRAAGRASKSKVLDEFVAVTGLYRQYAMRTLRKAAGPGRVSRDGRARLSNLMGIHKALRIIFSEAARGYVWIRTANEAFGGASALDVMLGGELTDIMRVRRYLDATRGGR